ncbi:MAG: isoprenylcysteine carboxylmethyltransferase family protein [Spirochaetota bacterium]
MSIIGKTTINPVVFYTGKSCGYILWVVLLLDLLNINVLGGLRYQPLVIASYVLLGIGALFIMVSLINLGASVRLGLPPEKTTFKSKGIYRLSRNPMYIGLHLLTLAAMLNTIHIVFILMGVYSIITYHFIILGEERFLKNRFGKKYIDYTKKVRRYL